MYLNRRLSVVCSLLALIGSVGGCGRDFALPQAPGAGSVSGRLVVAVPGRLDPEPAVGAELQVLGTNIADVAADDGRFRLTPILSEQGKILIRYARREDGTWARQRLLDFADIDAAPGRDISLGDVLLFENATIQGRVLRGDVAGRPRGHGATTIFLPEGPYTTQSGDDGAYLLQSVPPGKVTLAFFREGYAPATVGPLSVRPGENVQVRPVELVLAPAAAATLTVRGALVFQPPISDASDAEVVARDVTGEVTLPVAADGTYRADLPVGLYTFIYDHSAYGSVYQPNVLVIDTDGSGTLDLPLITLIEGQDDVVPPDPGGNGPAEAPIARITSPLIGRAGGAFILDGTTSSQADAHALSYRWTQTAGDAVDLSPNDVPEASTTVFVAPAIAQTLSFELEVTDLITGKQHLATTDIVFGTPPVAVVSAPALVKVGDPITLDASASIASGGSPLSFSWRQSGGDIVTLPDNDSETAAVVTFSAPAIEQTIRFGLTVTDTVTGLAGTASVSMVVQAPPVAAIRPTGIVAVNEVVTLDASGTTVPDGGGASYLWAQTGGEAVTLSDNDSVFAGTVTFTAPATAGALTFDLTVTDLRTSLTDTRTVVVIVAPRPIAVVSPSSLIVGSSVALRFDGSASVPGTGASLTYAWTVEGADMTVTSTDLTISEVRVTSGSSAFTVTLVVNDGTLTSDPMVGVVAIDDLAVVDPTLDVPPAYDAEIGGAVVMQVRASHPNTLETFTYAWTQVSGTPVSLVEILVDPTTHRATFMAPAAVEQLVFQIVVDGSSGGQAMATVVVDVQDRTAPMIVAMDPVLDGGTGARLYASVTFDEAVDPASLTDATVWIADATGAKVLAALRWDPATLTVWLVPDEPLVPGAAYVLNVGAVSDTALPPNVRTTTATRSYTPRARRWTTWVSTWAVGRKPYSAVIVTPAYGVQVFAAFKPVGTSSWTVQYWTPDNTGALNARAFMIIGMSRTYGRRGHVVLGVPTYHASLSTQFGSYMMQFDGTDLIRKNGDPDVIFTDGLKMHGAREDSGLIYGEWNAATNAWSSIDIDPVSGTSFSYNTPRIYGFASTAGRLIVFGSRRDSNTYSNIQVFEGNGGAFTKLAGTSAGGGVDGSYDTGDHPVLRGTFVGSSPLVTFAGTAYRGNRIGAAWWDNVASAWVTLPDAGVGAEHDVAAHGRTLYLARLDGSLLYVDRIYLDAATPAWTSVPGPTDVPLNVGLSCQASQPEWMAVDDALYLTFGESCDGGTTWDIVLRRLE